MQYRVCRLRKKPAISLREDDRMSSDGHVLLVDDEPMVRDVLSRYLERSGFAVTGAGDGEAALAAFDRAKPDLVLLDLMLPLIDGIEVFRRIRSRAPVPVIMLTARGEEINRIAGLELGADDYVTKPISPREVVARVKAVLRRGVTDDFVGPVGTAGSRRLVLGDLVLDGASRECLLDRASIILTPKEFDLLYLMASNPRVALTRSDLLERVWDVAFRGDPSTVTVHIRRLRQKIEADPSRPTRIVTVWGHGYRFEP